MCFLMKIKKNFFFVFRKSTQKKIQEKKIWLGYESTRLDVCCDFGGPKFLAAIDQTPQKFPKKPFIFHIFPIFPT